MLRGRRTILAVSAVALVTAVAQYAAWRAAARHSLPAQVPRMLRYQLLSAERRMAPLNVWPRDVHIVLANPLSEGLAMDVGAFQKAYAPAAVRVSSERAARAAGYLVKWRCRGCNVVWYKEERNNPVFARVAVSVGGDHAVGYDHTFLHVFGWWVHLRTRFLWIT